MVFTLSAFWRIRIRGLWKLPDQRDWLREKLGLVLMGGAMLSQSLIQFSFDGRGCVPFLLFDLRPDYGGGNEDNGDLLQKVQCMHCHTQCPRPCTWPPLTHASARDSWTLTGKSGSVSCGVTAPFSWILVHISFCLCPPRGTSPVLCKFWQLFGGVDDDPLKRANATPRSSAPRAPALAAVHCWPVPPQETLKESSGSVPVGFF